MAFVAGLEQWLGESFRIGEALPDRERVRFRHAPSLCSQAGDIEKVQVCDAPPREKIAITTTFLGLAGVASPLPSYLAEEVVMEDEPQSLRSLLDVFHHRLLSLLYRALRSYQGGTAVDQLAAAHRIPSDWALDPALFPIQLLPLCMGRRRGRDVLVLGLGATLQQIAPQIRVSLTSLTGGAESLEHTSWCRLGRQRHRLGQSLVLGHKALNPRAMVSLKITGLTSSLASRFQRGGDLYQATRFWVRRAAKLPIGVRLALEVEGVVPMHLRSFSSNKSPATETSRNLPRQGFALGRATVLAGQALAGRVPTWLFVEGPAPRSSDLTPARS